MKRKGEDLDRVISLPGWRHSPYYTDAERAALALTEALTRLADASDPVPDAVWNEAARHYDQTAAGRAHPGDRPDQRLEPAEHRGRHRGRRLEAVGPALTRGPVTF